MKTDISALRAIMTSNKTEMDTHNAALAIIGLVKSAEDRVREAVNGLRGLKGVSLRDRVQEINSFNNEVSRAIKFGNETGNFLPLAKLVDPSSIPKDINPSFISVPSSWGKDTTLPKMINFDEIPIAKEAQRK